jgi:hypothetical protein
MRQALKLHPDSRCLAATRVDVEVARPHPGQLLLQYVVSGTIARLRLPPATATARAHELWQHTCFEAFLRAPSSDAYYELNFAPSRQWAAYRFAAYRAAMTIADEVSTPYIEVAAEVTRYELKASMGIPGLPSDAAWRLGLAAVIEETSGRKSYWALAHPPGQADFHHADGFACELRP